MAALTSAKRIVVKIGSALLVDRETGELRAGWLHSLANDVAWLKRPVALMWCWSPPVPSPWGAECWVCREQLTCRWNNPKRPLRSGKSGWPAPMRRRWHRTGSPPRRCW